MSDVKAVEAQRMLRVTKDITRAEVKHALHHLERALSADGLEAELRIKAAQENLNRLLEILSSCNV